MKEITVEAKTREEALSNALEQLGVAEDQVEVEEIPQKERFFGFLQSKIVQLIVRVKETSPDAEDMHPALDEPRRKISEPLDPNSPESLAKDFIDNILQRMNVDVSTELEIYDGAIHVYLEGGDSGMIIGKFGQTLDSLQYLTNIFLGKKTKEKAKVVIQVGDYRSRREASLRRMARAMAHKVIKSRKKIVLAPMPPQDRRIIHLALSNFRHVETGSEGLGPDRRVVINYKD